MLASSPQTHPQYQTAALGLYYKVPNLEQILLQATKLIRGKFARQIILKKYIELIRATKYRT
jgi:hypothetical protein